MQIKQEANFMIQFRVGALFKSFSKRIVVFADGTNQNPADK